MPIKDPNFSSVARSKANPVYDMEDINRMNDYQKSLIDTYLYQKESEPGKQITTTEKESILHEIKKIERWIKSETVNIVNKSIIL